MTANRFGKRTVEMLLLLSICLVSGVSSPQTKTASISGSVRDANGAVVPGATLTLTMACDCQANECKGYTCSECCPSFALTTDDSGEFRFTSLRAGAYMVKATSPGFSEAQISVTVANEEQKSVDVTLTVGGSD